MILLNSAKKYPLLMCNAHPYRTVSKEILPKVKYSQLVVSCPKTAVSAGLSFRKNLGGKVPFPEYPDYYMELVSEKFVQAVPERVVKYSSFEHKFPAVPAHMQKEYNFKPHYRIDKLYSLGKGSGTNAVQKVVRESLFDKETEGRVLVYADCIDGYSYPSGFYYKLGFRFNKSDLNQQFEQWLKTGGKKENAPTVSGMMHLPKENIEHCLNYGK